MAEVRKEILDFLDRERIPYELYEHERAFHINQCLDLPFMNDETVICKNALLCNRQQTVFYLMLLCPHTPFRTSAVSRALGVSRLSFAPESTLTTLMHLSAGSVSPLGLYFDKEHLITLCYEAAVRIPPKIAFHPCDNAATVVFTQDTFWQEVLPKLGIKPIGIALNEDGTLR